MLTTPRLVFASYFKNFELVVKIEQTISPCPRFIRPFNNRNADLSVPHNRDSFRASVTHQPKASGSVSI